MPVLYYKMSRRRGDSTCGDKPNGRWGLPRIWHRAKDLRHAWVSEVIAICHARPGPAIVDFPCFQSTGRWTRNSIENSFDRKVINGCFTAIATPIIKPRDVRGFAQHLHWRGRSYILACLARVQPFVPVSPAVSSAEFSQLMRAISLRGGRDSVLSANPDSRRAYTTAIGE